MIIPPRRMLRGEQLTAELYNALLDYVRRIQPIQGANVRVDYVMGGARISGTPGGTSVKDDAAAGLKPFAVRYHAGEGDGAESQWEIYMPAGCFTVGNPLARGNKPANETAGHEGDDDGWRLLYFNESEGEGTQDVGEDGETFTTREFQVTVHGKYNCMQTGVDDLQAMIPTGYVVASCCTTEVLDLGDEDDPRNLCNWGDVQSAVVAKITIVTEDGSPTEPTRMVAQYLDSAITAQAPTRSSFELVWWFSLDGNGETVLDNVYCTVKLAAAAGTVIEDDSLSDVKDAERVFLHIISDGTTDEAEIITDPSATEADDQNTWVPLYLLADNCVADDFRHESLTNLQIYG